MSTGPTINRGGSIQAVETPNEFIAVVERKFGRIGMDLAANFTNRKAGHWFGEIEDSLAQHWHVAHATFGLCWLNPPYSNITPWVAKCAGESRKGAEILLLVPGSIGANWYWDFVEPYADVYSVGRMKFVGHSDPYPKDLILCHYTTAQLPTKMVRWRWQDDQTTVS